MCVTEYGVDVAIEACTNGIYETADPIDNDQQLSVKTNVIKRASVWTSIDEVAETFTWLSIE